MKNKNVFVTVGTTKFQKLINTMSSKTILNILSELGYIFVQIQTGIEQKDLTINSDFEKYSEKDSVVVKTDSGLTLKYDKYFDCFEEEIKRADLVISHAGAGSCLDVLRHNKPLLVVINEDLMDNHQLELAEQLQENGYVYYCTCDTLTDVLNKDFTALKMYPCPEKDTFSSYLNKCCGFIE